MELGVSPLVTASMILEFLSTSKIVEIDQSLKEDRVLWQTSQKVCGIAFTMVQAVMYVSSGMYGDPKQLGGNTLLLVAQLTFSGFLVTMLDEIMQKGWGMGSGISLFITTNVAETIAWKAMSPASVNTGTALVYEGAITSFLHQLLFSSNRLSAITEAFYRPYGPNLTNLVATAFVFIVVVYLQGFRVDLAVKPQRVRGQIGNYPIKIFYTSQMPIILHAAVISNLYFFSQLMWKRFKGNLFVSMIGQWQEVEYTGEQYPVGGLVYYLSPPTSILNFVLDPFRSIIYAALTISSCAFLSKAWVDVSGEAPRDVAKRLIAQGLTIVGHRDVSMVATLAKYIPQCAQLGGALIGILTIAADLLGCIGSGTGILLAVTITYGYFEQFARENAQKGAIMA